MAGGKVREIKRRIKGVKNTHQITKAMDIVSSTKFRRMNEMVLNSRPYSVSLENILKNMEIRLPVDSNDNIDYTYITTFIQAQEKLSIKSVIDWKDKIINTSKKCI